MVLDELLVELDDDLGGAPFRLQLDVVRRRRSLRSVSSVGFHGDLLADRLGDQVEDRGLPPLALEVDLAAVAPGYDGAPDGPRARRGPAPWSAPSS